jgi:RNA polymerase-binding transcription factor DksA
MHHHYFTIEQRKTLERLIGTTIGVGTLLDAALERLHQPDYGVCIECGKDIEFVLLEADPLAVHCRACSRLPVSP